MKNLTIILIIAALLFSCTKDIELNNKNQEQKDVVQCILSADSTVELILYKSNLPLSSSNKFTLIKDAQVELKESNNIETLQFTGTGNFIENGVSQGSYNSNKVIEENKTYQLSITGNNNKDLSSEIFIPKSPQILKPTIVRTAEDIELRFTINDPIDESNYYSIEMFYIYVSYNAIGTDTIFSEPLSTTAYLYSKKDNSGFITFDDDLSGGEVLFDDKLFSNGDNQIKLFADPDYISYSEEYDGYYYGNKVINAYIIVSSLNKTLYEYRKAFQAQKGSEGNLFSEPTQITSNIKNGIGVFGSRTIKRFDVDF